MQPASSHPVNHLADYQPPDWLVPDVRLEFDLGADTTEVRAILHVVRNGEHQRPLVLDGEDLELLQLSVDGADQPLPNDSRAGLRIALDRAECEIETRVRIHPADNTRLMGLYRSGNVLLTQCEAEGFRRITYFPDRPDVLARYSVRLVADRAAFPVLLSNGNCDSEGVLADGRHYAEWSDPFPKPSYLFALVAGAPAVLRDSFRTSGGREVALAIWVQEGDAHRARHAMDSLKAAMRFDEEEYGREYDLSQFNIVAVRDFNFGAMENKSLNIFNSKYILADTETATDADFDAIAGVVAHEYFHNWSGNRVTCRDWFQLCLKEGFTVFRDQHFTESRNSAAQKRIETARVLRTQQFPEDAGPLAHPVRPQSYIEISNFYTATIYEKGAELIRMLKRILGPERFRRATDRYFAANDGRAATIEDFLHAMAEEGLDAARFHRWYDQPGTPRLSAELLHDRAGRGAQLVLAQTNPGAPGAAPLPIPLDLALFSRAGDKLFQCSDVVFDQPTLRLAVPDVDGDAVLSLNRGFAAPVIVQPLPPAADLLLLARHEDDPFARYEAIQQRMQQAILYAVASGRDDDEPEITAVLSDLLAGWHEDPAFVAEALQVPGEGLIGDRMALVDPAAIHAARGRFEAALGRALQAPMAGIWAAIDPDPGDLSPMAKGSRRLKGVLLSYLVAGDSAAGAARALQQFEGARSMTDRMAALVALSHSDAGERVQALAQFRARYRDFPDVLDKWFLVQASSMRADTREVVEALLLDAEFSRRNPNRLRALVGGFGANQTRLHDAEGAGYRLLVREVLAVDPLNPQSAARLVQPLTRWRRFADPYGAHMRSALADLAAHPALSRDLAEIVTNSLA